MTTTAPRPIPEPVELPRGLVVILAVLQLPAALWRRTRHARR